MGVENIRSSLLIQAYSERQCWASDAHQLAPLPLPPPGRRLEALLCPRALESTADPQPSHESSDVL